MQKLDHLNTLCVDTHGVRISGEDYPILHVRNKFAELKVALHGAHVISYIPVGAEDVIFTSESAIYKEGKAIRGGIPVCWPWFNAHPSDTSKPSHGFVRNRFWELAKVNETADETVLVFQMPVFEEMRQLYPYDVEVSLEVVLGAELHVNIVTENKGEVECPVGGALHTYLSVSSIDDVSLTGLDGVGYFDSLTGETKKQAGDITISEELDVIYENSDHTVTLQDKQRCIQISKTGSLSTVVWNPWIEKSQGIADLGNEDYRDFVCIETANARNDVVMLQSGCKHVMSQIISL